MQARAGIGAARSLVRRGRGLVRRRALAVQERLFDARRGVTTAGVDATVTVAGGEASTGYQAVHPRAFATFVGRLDAAPADCTFVDIGSGRGRGVILAVEHGFGSAVGVEFEPAHHALAVENLRRYRERTGRGAQARLVEGDAVRFELPPGPVVLFLYNPFGPEVLAPFVDRTAAAFLADPRPMWLIYEHPLHRELLDANPVFEIVAEHRDALRWTHQKPQYVVYRLAAPAATA